MNKGNKIHFIENTTAKVVQCLYYHSSLPSSDISSYIDKSIPHTIKLLGELIAQGYVAEKGYGTSSGGRKPLHYSLAGELFYSVSVAITRFSIQLATLDNNNAFVGGITRRDINLRELGAADIVTEIENYIAKTGIERDKILGAGITMPGFIDPHKGVNYTFLPVAEGSLVNYLQQGLSMPVFIENDSTAIALAEQKFGVARQQDNAMIINLGWGIGLGMIVNGGIFRGHSGLAGEFSHLPLVKNGKLCNCGKHGCLETEASLIAIIEKAHAELQRGQNSTLKAYETIDADAIIAEAIKGDSLAVRLISEAAYYVGQCLAILIHIMNPAAIVLSGKASAVGRLWMAPIQQAINEHCIPRLAADTVIMVSELKNTAQLIGGAVLVIENLGKPLAGKLSSLQKASPLAQAGDLNK